MHSRPLLREHPCVNKVELSLGTCYDTGIRWFTAGGASYNTSLQHRSMQETLWVDEAVQGVCSWIYNLASETLPIKDQTGLDNLRC